MNSDFLRRQLAHRLTIEKESVSAYLTDGLLALEQRIRWAREVLARGDKLDVHLISNSVALTGEIARWNQILELLPYTSQPDES